MSQLFVVFGLEGSTSFGIGVQVFNGMDQKILGAVLGSARTRCVKM